MEHFIVTMNIVLPIFLLMVAGFVSRRIGWVTESSAMAMNKIVFKLFLPVSLCRSIMNVTEATVDWLVPVICVVATVACFGLGFLIIPKIEPQNSRRSVMIQGMFRSNYALFGVTLIEALFPAGDGGFSAMMVMVIVPLYNVLGVFTLEWYRGGKPEWLSILAGAAKNPLNWGCIVGFVILKSGLEMPYFAVQTIDKLASVASPLAMFALGAMLNLKSLGKNRRNLTIVVFARLILIPGVVLLTAYLMGVSGIGYAVLMIAFGTPCAVASYVMSSQMGGDGELAAQQVMLTTALSSASMFLWIFVSKTMGIL